MYYGKMTDELRELRKQYRQKFGYDPNGDVEIEMGESDYEDYVKALRESILSGKDIFETLHIEY